MVQSKLLSKFLKLISSNKQFFSCLIINSPSNILCINIHFFKRDTLSDSFCNYLFKGRRAVRDMCIVYCVCYINGRPHVCAHTIVPRHVCAHTRLCPHTFVPRHDCAHTRLCPDTIVPTHVCAQIRLCPHTFVPTHDCAHTRLCPHTNKFVMSIMTSRKQVRILAFVGTYMIPTTAMR